MNHRDLLGSPDLDRHIIGKIAREMRRPLNAIAIVAGDILCGLRFESPSGETGNMFAPFDLFKHAIIYQGDDAGRKAARECSDIFGDSRNPIALVNANIPLLITSKELMESELPDGYRKIEVKFSYHNPSEIDSQSKGRVDIQNCENEYAYIMLPPTNSQTRSGTGLLMFEEVVDAPRQSATEDDVHCFSLGCKKLSNKDAELLAKLAPHQRCKWRSDLFSKTDSIVHGLRSEICSAIVRLTAATENQRVEAPSTSTTTTATAPDGQKETHDIAVENLRVQIDISNSLRGIWETLHSRGANFTHASD
ncbi:hypothetical protein H9Q72_009492 [Fusarium xylarioides]|uniref:Uncharacterized protein n=1 Tax=Fusarium xylarioides TaxID=221167 RepID=A0A9P7HLC2_9HYPO|nr:hypothetical protein H9Q70_008592 [Fusarium xylarioides]KAG5762392.1 hypothetical protein H9Q72_009492 [Fusarium xylarioides]